MNGNDHRLSLSDGFEDVHFMLKINLSSEIVNNKLIFPILQDIWLFN